MQWSVSEDDILRFFDAAKGHVDPESQAGLFCTMVKAHLLGTDKPPPKDPTEVQARNDAARELRKTLTAYLVNNNPATYTGERATACSATEILEKAGIAESQSSLNVLRSILHNQRFIHNWGIVDEVMGLKLYAHTPKLLRFQRAA